MVFHLAAQPGVRLSWAEGFLTYGRITIEVDQRLLESVRGRGLQRFVCASSSSVYGEASVLPTSEEQPTRPYRPYGVTKLAGEHLCLVYETSVSPPSAPC